MKLIFATAILLSFFGFAIYIARRYGILESISSSSYAFQGNEKYKFLAVLWFVAILNLFMGMEVFGFLSSVGIIFTGITVNHREKLEKHIHYIGVFSAIAAQYLGFIVLHNEWLPAILLLLTFIGLKVVVKKNLIWYGELVAMFWVWFGYMLIY